MCKFIHLNYLSEYQSLHYIIKILNCYKKYSKFLCDDFVPNDLEFILSKIPFLWAICTQDDEFMGFVFLDNFVGNRNTNYSAELTTCFEKKAWGSFTRYSAKFFLKYCFDEFNLHKIQAQIYPQNFRIKTLLQSTGFIYETTIPKATLRNGKEQDIQIYSLYRNYYYKNEVKK